MKKVLLWCGFVLLASSVMAQELPARLSFQVDPVQAPVQQEAQPQARVQTIAERAAAPRPTMDEVMAQNMKERKYLQDPLTVKLMYMASRQLDDSIQKAQEDAFENTENENPEKLAAQKEQAERETPIRFGMKAEDRVELTQSINQDPARTLVTMTESIKGQPMEKDSVRTVMEEQRKIVERMNQAYKDENGMTPAEFEQLRMKQAEEEMKPKIPPDSLTDEGTIITGEIDVSDLQKQ